MFKSIDCTNQLKKETVFHTLPKYKVCAKLHKTGIYKKDKFHNFHVLPYSVKLKEANFT